MLFNSYVFIFLFLPISLVCYFYLNKKEMATWSKVFLVLASLFYYSWWNIAYLPLIVGSVLFNYFIGNNLSKKKILFGLTGRGLLTIGIVCNLTLLGYFKYADFFITNINLVFEASINHLSLILPLAISFFTFQQIAYLVDSYSGDTKEYDFLNYSLFVLFFPQLIAGPIIHHKEVMPQFANSKNKLFSHKNFATGIYLFTLGLFKKAVIADSFAPWANSGFDLSDNLNMLEAWATSLSYSFQLYFDFSGYSDMALGIGLMFNIMIPENFNSPYKALNIQDFWRRWHITLSRFLRDYIYIPLGGNRFGEWKNCNNLLITFLIGGLWHGAGWTFVFWGFLHGAALICHRIWVNLGFKMNNLLAWFITFNFVNVTWIFFRAKTWDDALKVLKGMFMGEVVFPAELAIRFPVLTEYGLEFGAGIQKIGGNKEISIALVFAFIIVLFLKNTNDLSKQFKPKIFNLLIVCLFFVYSVVSFLSVKSEFLYFDF